MNTFQKIFLLFIFGCVVARSIFVIIALKIPKNYLPYFGIIGIVIGIGFIYTFISNKKARGGSKGIPKKNVVNFNNKPLIYHTINGSFRHLKI